MEEFISIIGKLELDKRYKITKVVPLDIKDFLKETKSTESRKISESLNQPKFYKEFIKQNLRLSKLKIKASVSLDNLISQTINSISENNKILNIIIKRLREWYALTNPEYERVIQNNERLVKEILKKDIFTSVMGAILKKHNISAIKNLAILAQNIYDYQEEAEKYLREIMQEHCPNLLVIAGPTIGAKLIEHIGSLKKLAFSAASKIQILGAEKAIFRHLKTGARPPKYGLLHEHQFILGAKKMEHGKRARALADKISIAVKVDFFKGKPIAVKLKKDLEAKFK